jgi:hypothetical protein
MSEYILPELPAKTPLLTPLTSEKKSLLMKSTQSTKQTTPLIPSQKPISVFLTPTKPSSSTMSLAARKSSMLDRIREKSTNQAFSQTKSASAAWDRGEWCISNLFMFYIRMKYG